MSSKQTKEFVFEWDIPSFSLDFYKPDDFIESPLFQVDAFGGSQWKIRLYPRGESECKLDSECLSCYLYKEKNDIYSCECSLSFELELIGDGKSIGKAKTSDFAYKLNERNGWQDYIFSRMVSDKLKAWPENILTVRLHMFNTNSKCGFPDLKLRAETPVNRVSFTWHLSVSNISSERISKDISFTETLVYEMTLRKLQDAIKICINQKGDQPLTLPLLVACNLSLLDSKGNQLKFKYFRHLFKTADELWEFPPFITCKDIDNDVFYLFCELFSSNGIRSAKAISFGLDEGDRTISKDLKSMLHQHIYSDVKLKSGNEILHAHKCILAARSPVFTAMFAQDMIESTTNVVDISDFESDVLMLFLQFLYTDTIDNLDCEKAEKLLVIADKYQVSALIEKCAMFLESNLSLENATEILSVADLIGHNRLKKLVLNFVTVDSAIIFSRQEWKDLMQENNKLAAEMLSLLASDYKIVSKS